MLVVYYRNADRACKTEVILFKGMCSVRLCIQLSRE